MNKLLNESEDLGQAREEFHRFWMNNQPSVLNESEDLGQAREEFHRFWMNNQPSVLTYERLSGAIGP
ncbi:MAG TPA: hypothetical protein VKE40_18915 [Gemmataceae bacterium]|nr:hypothetical protein [Gemmataceae bacterium]